MKKKIAYLSMTLILALSLCGCGNDRTETTHTPSPTTAVSASPSTNVTVSPDMEDGEVNDTDGIIEDDNAAGSEAEASASPSSAVKK